MPLRFETFVLANGLRVIFHEDRRLPIVAVNVWYDVGAKDEATGRSGFAHLFEHLMFMGTHRVPVGKFDSIMEAGGGRNNAATSFDWTAYWQSGPRSLLPTLLWLEADRMEALGSAMTKEKLDLQRDVVRNERRQSYEIEPYGKADLVICEHMFPAGHPYRMGLIGSHEELEAARVEDVKAFFAQYYVPNNASLSVAGDFDPAETRALVERLMGSLPRGPDPVRNIVPPVALRAGRRATLQDPQVELPRTSLVWHSPPSYEAGDAEMDLAAAVLTRGKTGRLYERLVYRERIAQDVAAFQQSMSLGSLFQVELTASPDVPLETVERAADEELARLAQEGPTPEELQRVVNGIESANVSALQSIAAVADRLNAYQFWFGTPDGLERDLDRYRRATPEGVRDWVRKVLHPERRLLLRVVPPATPGGGDRDAAPAPAAHGRLRLDVPGEFHLASGLRVWHLPRHELPLVACRLVLDAGSAEDPAGRVGTAALVAELLTEGAGAHDALAFGRAVESLGARIAAGADRDGSSLSLEVLRPRLEAALELFAAAATAPRFDEGDWERVQAQTLAGLKQQDGDPAYVARRLALSTWFGPGHPYELPPEGRPQTLARITREDVRGSFAGHYGPNRATLLVAGDVSRSDLEPLLERVFGSWRPVPRAPRRAAPAPAGIAHGLRLLLADRPGAAQTVVRFLVPAPPYATPDRLTLEALSSLFGGSFSSRLTQNLRETKGYAYAPSSLFAFLSQAGWLVAAASVATNVTGPALAEFQHEFQRMQRGDIVVEEAVKAQAALRQNVVETVSTLGGLLATYASAVIHRRSPAEVAADVASLEEPLEPAVLNALAGRHFTLARGVLVLVGDRAAILPQLEGLGLPEPEMAGE